MDLTPRQREVLQAIVLEPNPQRCRILELGLSPRGYEKQLAGIRRAMGVGTTIEAVVNALELGIVRLKRETRS